MNLHTLVTLVHLLLEYPITKHCPPRLFAV